MTSEKPLSRDLLTNIRIRMPCEIVTEYLLPTIRRSLAEELVIRRGVSQLLAAKIIGVTQPAISNYLHSEPNPRGKIASTNEIDSLVKDLCEDLLTGRLTQSDSMKMICGFCIKMRSHGPICAIHEEEVKELQAEGCLLCLTDLAGFKGRSLEDTELVFEVKKALRVIEGTKKLAALVPEIGMNITYAKVNANKTDDVVGIPGRIHPIGGYPRSARPPELGGSSHVARAVLSMRAIQPQIRSAISLKYERQVIDICKEMGLTVSSFDRAEEPPEVKSVDGRTIQWGIGLAARRSHEPPQIVYDTGDIGKEPMIFLFGANPLDVANLAAEIAETYSKKRRFN